MTINRLGAPHTRVAAHNQHIKRFHELIDSFHTVNPWQVFIDCLNAFFCACLSDRTKDHPREKQFMEIVGKYRAGKGEIEGKFGEMLARICLYMTETRKEILSHLWEEYAANAKLGQFFTPWDVCLMMCEMNGFKDVDWTKYSRENPCLIHDPACGGARTLIAPLQYVPPEKMDSVFLHGVDIDANVCIVAALNFVLFNVNGYVIHGNMLTLEVWHVYRSIRTPFGGKLVEITDKDQMKRIITMGHRPKKPEPEPETKPAQVGQLSLI